MLKEIFATIILSLFYPEGSWLNELTSMDHMVEANKINLSEVGADPLVVKDNNVWPLPPTSRTDSGIEIPLSTFDTVPTHVTNVDELETSYDKCQSVVMQHANALRTKAMMSAAQSIAPQDDTYDHPILMTSGQLRDYAGALLGGASGIDLGTEFMSLTYADILHLRTIFNRANYPMDGRVLVLCPEHEEDLLREDANRYNMMMTTGQIAGFKVYVSNHGVRYAPGDDGWVKCQPGEEGVPSSFAFYSGEVMRAMGSIEGEPEKRFADYRGWLLGFQMRFVAMPFRGKGIAAIVSTPSDFIIDPNI